MSDHALSAMNNQAIERFQSLYKQLNRDSISHQLISACYDESVVFIDPLHRVEGILALTDYFVAMYSNVEEIEFHFTDSWHSDNKSMLRWNMSFRHPRIKSGQWVSVEGCSELHWQDEKIISHQDFYDAGAMLYEHLPLLGWAIRKLKERIL